MIIHVEVSNQQKMHYLIELLKSMDFVERIKVDEEMQVNEKTSTPLSSKYWGAWQQNPLSIEEIDTEVQKMREEWD